MQDTSKQTRLRQSPLDNEDEEIETMSSLQQCLPDPSVPSRHLSWCTDTFQEDGSIPVWPLETIEGSIASTLRLSEMETLPLTDENRVLDEITSDSVLRRPSQRRHLGISILDLDGEIMEDVDSRDAPPAQSPIHQAYNLHSDTPVSSESVSTNSIWKPRGLTLSAFRRPENTIRLTQSDPSRRLEAEYGLHGAGVSGVLGHGAFSTVRLAVRLCDGVQVAVKTIAKHEAIRSRRLRRVDESGSGTGGTTSNRHHYMEEWEILRRLQGHPHVVKLLDVFETTEEIQLVTEFCAGGELFDAIQKKNRRNGNTGSSEAQAAQITLQILQALEKVHSLNIVHRDVKPENILLAKLTEDDESVHVKLCDFGVARPLVSHQEVTEASLGVSSAYISSDGEASPLTPGSRSRSFSTVGTDYYAAPELTYGGSYDTAVDIYSLGVTLYILLCGFPPVFGSPIAPTVATDDDSDGESFEEVLFPETYWSSVSSGAKALLKRMLHPNPTNRVTAKDAQNDHWIKTWVAPTALTPQSSPLCAPVDMNLVRSKLYKSLEVQLQELPPPKISSKRRHSCMTLQDNAIRSSRKRAWNSYSHATPHPSERRASTTALMALADLYRGVAAPVLASTTIAPPNTVDSIDRTVVSTPSTPDGRTTAAASFVASSIRLPAESF